MRTGTAPPVSISTAPRTLRGTPASLVFVMTPAFRGRDDGALSRRTKQTRDASGDGSRDHDGAARGRTVLKPCRFRSALAWILVAGTVHLAGCAHGAGAATTPASVAASTPMNQRDGLPEALGGVWYRDDPAGHAQCTRYRAASPHTIDEESIAMIGSLVITPGLVHAYAEYGEGTFFVVKAATRNAAAWRIDVAIGMDTIPAGDADDGSDVYRLELDQDKLRWEPWDSAVRSPAYFRCDAVRSDYLGRATP